MASAMHRRDHNYGVLPVCHRTDRRCSASSQSLRLLERSQYQVEGKGGEQTDNVEVWSDVDGLKVVFSKWMLSVHKSLSGLAGAIG